MIKLGKEGRIRLAMAASFLACAGIAMSIIAMPYLEGAETAEMVMSYRSEAFDNVTKSDNGHIDLPGETPIAASKELDDREEHASKVEEPPSIDWQGLKALNSDVIGWIRVPKTRIDYPLVQASNEEPQYYLGHDLMQQESPYGCPYLEPSAASQGGLDAPFPIMYGHHLINGLMFSDFAKFSDPTYAEQHREIVVETPTKTIQLRVIGANVVDANEELIQTSFSSIEELNEYVDARLSESEVVLASNSHTPYHQVFCFVTCSYGSENERTLVYAVPESEEQEGE